MRVAIVEDEKVIAERLERMTRELLGGHLELLNRFDTFEAAKNHLQRTPIDLLLLDLNLHGEDGLDLLKESAAGSFHTVVVSANTEQALRAFEYGVLDFVPKPFRRDRLSRAFDRLLDGQSRADYGARFLALPGVGGMELVAVHDILWAAGSGSYSELVLRDGGRRLHNKNLERLIAILPPHFERVHKSYVVNMNEAKHLHSHPGSRYEVELLDGTRLPVGRTRFREIREKLTREG